MAYFLTALISFAVGTCLGRLLLRKSEAAAKAELVSLKDMIVKHFVASHTVSQESKKSFIASRVADVDSHSNLTPVAGKPLGLSNINRTGNLGARVKKG